MESKEREILSPKANLFLITDMDKLVNPKDRKSKKPIKKIRDQHKSKLFQYDDHLKMKQGQKNKTIRNQFIIVYIFKLIY